MMWSELSEGPTALPSQFVFIASDWPDDSVCSTYPFINGIQDQLELLPFIYWFFNNNRTRVRRRWLTKHEEDLDPGSRLRLLERGA